MRILQHDGGVIPVHLRGKKLELGRDLIADAKHFSFPVVDGRYQHISDFMSVEPEQVLKTLGLYPTPTPEDIDTANGLLSIDSSVSFSFTRCPLSIYLKPLTDEEKQKNLKAEEERAAEEGDQ